MSGHSKWASIKHKKGAADAKRGKLFSKLAKELTVAARSGGGDTNTNAQLRMLVNKAKAANMAADNIIRAIKKGTGELPGVTYEEITYEAYGPKGIAILIEVLTDNKNRTTAEIRAIFTKRGGSIAGQGSVQWMFNKKGFILVKKESIGEDEIMGIALEAGAEDMKHEGDMYEITTSAVDFEKVKAAFEEKNINIESAEITMVPSSAIKVESADAKSVLSLVDALEDHDDVQNVYANFDIPDNIIEEASGRSE